MGQRKYYATEEILKSIKSILPGLLFVAVISAASIKAQELQMACLGASSRQAGAVGDCALFGYGWCRGFEMLGVSLRGINQWRTRIQEVLRRIIGSQRRPFYFPPSLKLRWTYISNTIDSAPTNSNPHSMTDPNFRNSNIPNIPNAMAINWIEDS